MATNRRTFFTSLGAAGAGIVAGRGAVCQSHEPAHDLAGAPMCPRCQSFAQYVGSSWESRPDTPEPVECGCGWSGAHVRIRSNRAGH